ncbi:hypothetical protein, partial [Fodinibius sp.]|uniref:hypothetical protein n=1 Tax=Fodinibius sp. TaxID=1872440 RepID=UPI0035649212
MTLSLCLVPVTLFALVIMSLCLAPAAASGQSVSHTTDTDAPFLSSENARKSDNDSDCTPISDPNRAIYDRRPWPMHSIDENPLSGSDGVKRADVNGDGFPDLV